MPPRQPTKNLINMHDIIDQPLGALHDAVDAILRRPEMLDDVEVRGIFTESSFILLRAEEALAARNEVAFCSLFKLFSEGFAHSESSFEEGIKTMALHAPLLQTIHSIFRVVVLQGAFPLHSTAAVELIQVISSLCDGEAIKEMCGTLFMPGLAEALERVYAAPEEAMRFYHTQRGIATALINLVKGSKQNKTRLPSWRFVALSCTASVDVFFQLQCVELLFRVSRQNKGVLSQLEGAMPGSVAERLRSLPNDSSLLARMTALIEEINRGRGEVAQYRLTQVCAADTRLSEGTDAYFTPHYLIVMITSANADNVSIPYRAIRSVTLGRDGRVIFKLDEFPVKLEALLHRTAGMDTVTLHMPADKLNHFKQSPIRSWIVAALQARKDEEASHSQAHQPKPVAEMPAESLGAKRTATSPQQSTRVAVLEEAPSSLSIDINQDRKRSKVEAAEGGTLSSSRRSGASDDRKNRRGRAGGTVAAGALLEMIESLAQQSASPKETQAVFVQLKRLIDVKIEARRGETMTALNGTISRIQQLVDNTRASAQGIRVEWETRIAAEVDSLDQHISETRDVVTAAVDRLNEDLREVRSSNQVLNERIACVEVELQRTLEESREMEAGDWAAIETMCNQELERQEAAVSQRLLGRANPTGSIVDYIHGPSKADAVY